MALDLYTSLLDQGLSMGMERVLLHFQGEPLLHPKLAEMVAEAKKRQLYCSLFSNGQLISEEVAKDLTDAGLDVIRFSVDGSSEGVYQKNRRGGTFKKVYNNMAVTAIAAQGTNTKVIWQFIAMRNNEHEIPIAEEMAKEIGVQFFVKSFAETDKELATENTALRRRLSLKPCTDIYRQFCVFWDGRVVPCCYDVEGVHIMGDLRTQSLKEIWTSKIFRDFCSRVDNAVEDPASEPELCKRCLKWSLPGK